MCVWGGGRVYRLKVFLLILFNIFFSISVEQVYWYHLLTSCLSHFGNSIFTLCCYYCIGCGGLWPVVFGVNMVVVLETTCRAEIRQTMGRCRVCSDCSSDSPFPSLSPCPQAPVPQNTATGTCVLPQAVAGPVSLHWQSEGARGEAQRRGPGTTEEETESTRTRGC